MVDEPGNKKPESAVSPIRIRAVRLEDNAFLAELITQLGYPCSARQMHQRLQRLREHHDYGVFVAESSRQVIGLVAAQLSFHLTRDGRQGRLIALAVHEDHRGHGLGHQLMDHIEGWMRKQGASRIQVNSRTERRKAHQFYKNLGFERTGYRFVKELESEEGED